VASNEQKSALHPQRSLGQSRQAGTKIIVSDVANENAQIVLTNSPKSSSSSTVTIQQVVKTATPPSTSVSQSTSGVMTGANLSFQFRYPIQLGLPLAQVSDNIVEFALTVSR
jgi:hypothetical protein